MAPRTKKTPAPDIKPVADSPQEASPSEALRFIDGLLGKIAGSRQDHVAIQGAIGIIAKALDA